MVRFVTSSPLSWCGLLRGSEESRGSEAFTSGSPLATASQLQVLVMGRLADFSQCLQKHCVCQRQRVFLPPAR